MITTDLKRFYTYQNIRFPIIILVLSLLPAILSTTSVLNITPSLLKITGGVIASLLYLLHIRVTDEQRDFYHDSKHHKLRPLQTGQVSLKELRVVDVYAVTIFLVIAMLAGTYSFLLGLLMLSFSYLVGKEFLIREKIRQHFFIYNSINTVQTFIMQLFVYSFFAGYVPSTTLVAVHFIFTSIGTIIFEFTRKIKTPGMDGTGKDTYTWYLGFNKAVIIYIAFIFFITICFYQIMAITTGQNTLWLIISIILFGIACLIALIHLIKKTIETERLMQLSFVVVYAIFNLTIYIKNVGQ